MQRVIRRTNLARNQAKRKERIRQKREERFEVTAAIRERTQIERVRYDAERDARFKRRDDWLRGPLAPKHDSGPDKDHYGAMSVYGMGLPKIPEHLRRRYINIAKGDRVCLLKGPEKGKICVVDAVDPERESLTVRNAHQADVRMPDWIKESYGRKSTLTPMGVPISIDDVRLVVTLEENGSPYEAIAKHVYGGGPFLERSNVETPKHTRYIAGEDIPIPWPNEDAVDTFKDEEADTLRQEVEHETWEPSLMYAPFESSILDELRNKYSKYRTRHDPDWVKEKTLEDLKQEYLQSRTLLTPEGELRLRRAAEKAEARQSKLDANGNYVMGQETASFIAKYISRKPEAKSSTTIAREKAKKAGITG